MIHAFIPGTKTTADVIRDAVEMTPYWTDDPATHQDPYENAARALTAAGFGVRVYPSPREQWSFTGRETHWGHVFLVWTLIGNPSARNEMGKRFVRWVK